MGKQIRCQILPRGRWQAQIQYCREAQFFCRLIAEENEEYPLDGDEIEELMGDIEREAFVEMAMAEATAVKWEHSEY